MSCSDDKNFIFIIGSPRSGTTWLQGMLGSHPLVVGTIETTMFSRYLSGPLAAWCQEKERLDSGRWGKGLPLLITEAQFNEWMCQLLERCYLNIAARKPDARYILDKAPENTFHIHAIRRFLPHAKFIHIIRDGRDVVCSMRNAKRNLGHQTDNIAEGAAQWKMSVTTARESLTGCSCYYEVRYEALLADTSGEFSKILEFCEIPHTDELVNDICTRNAFDRMKNDPPFMDPDIRSQLPVKHYHKGKSGTWMDEMTQADRIDFESVAGRELVALGYANQGWIFPPQKLLIIRNRLKRAIYARLYYLCGAILGTKCAKWFYSLVLDNHVRIQ